MKEGKSVFLKSISKNNNFEFFFSKYPKGDFKLKQSV